MTQNYVPEEFIERLENWGRVYRDGNNEPKGITATYVACKRLKQASGLDRDMPVAQLNEDDARVIEWCFARSDVRMKTLDRALIKGHYVYRINPKMLCSRFRLGYKFYEIHLRHAVSDFYKIVQMLENFNVNMSYEYR